MSDVFISYKSEDRGAAALYATALADEGFSVWWDPVLRTGETYDEVIERNLREAAVVVVLWSPRSVKSKWVRAEATIGERKGALLPVLIEECERPIAFELTQTADLRGWSGDRADTRWEEFVGDLRAALSTHQAEVRAHTAPPPPDPLTIETLFWSSIKDGNDAADFEAYLQRYPHGHFVEIARNKANALKQSPRLAPPVAPPPPPREATETSTKLPRLPVLIGAAVAVLVLIGAGVTFWLNSAPQWRAYTIAELRRQPQTEYAVVIGRVEPGWAQRPDQLSFFISDETGRVNAHIPLPEAPADFRDGATIVVAGEWHPDRVIEAKLWSTATDDAALTSAQMGAVGAALRRRGLLPSTNGPQAASQPRFPVLPDARATPSATPAPVVQDPSQLVDFALFKDCADCPDMVVLPAGEYRIGSDRTANSSWYNEGPRRQVHITRFAVGRFEVTHGQWAAFVQAANFAPNEAGSSWFCNWRIDTDEKVPVRCVNWDYTQQFSRWMSQHTDRKYRLLTEAEWEYAARGGTTTPFWWGDTASHEYANYGRDTCCAAGVSGRDRWEATAPVGQFPANGFGLFDVTGNVWEWVQDCRIDEYAAVIEDGAAYEPQQCWNRMSRGGSWYSFAGNITISNRLPYPPETRYPGLGFRIARTLSDAEKAGH